MKTKLLTAIAVTLSLCGYAQTKGTSALSLGANITTDKSEINSSATITSVESKTRSFAIGYGYFNTDHSKIGFEFGYGSNTFSATSNQDTKVNSYSGNASYQHYYPIVKTLYAYAGGKAGYGYSKNEQNSTYNGDFTSSEYMVGAYGGLTWFVSKRFAFETNLLSSNVTYATNKQSQGYDDIAQTASQKRTTFNLNTTGFINNLGFKIYLLF